MPLKLLHSVIWTVFSCCILLSKPRDSTSEDPENPLILTPLIEAGLYDEAKNLSQVGPLGDTNIASFSGYLTVNPNYNSNMFFWFIPALSNPETAPVVLWLEGGPGATAMYSVLVEIGPWRITPDFRIYDANYTWSSVASLLYFENPIGTGFSFTDSDEGYATNEEDVARDLYNALQQFFTLFSEYQHQEFYVTGYSYGGKYAPAISHKIHEENPNAEIQINLKGPAIGNGLIDPLTQSNYGDYLFNVGLIDDAQRCLFQEQQNLAVQAIEAGDMMEALRHFTTLVATVHFRNDTYFRNFTGLHDIYNILVTKRSPSEQNYLIYLNASTIRKAIHVGNQTFDGNSKTVAMHMWPDIMNSTKSWVESLLNAGYKVLLYSGLVDACIPYPLTQDMVAQFNWIHSEEYKMAERVIWKVHPDDLEVAGYAKKVHNYQEVAVRNAGHMVPFDQPRAALDMLSRFIFDKPF